MHALLIAIVLFAQVSVEREVAVDSAAAEKTQAQIHDALTASARQKLERAGAKVEVKAAREAVTKAFPNAQLTSDTVDVLAFYVMSETSTTISAETKKLKTQRDELRETMKAAGVEPKGSATFALKLSGDYAKAPEPLAADAKPEAMAQRMSELAAMIDLNERTIRTVNERRTNLLKARHDISLNAIQNIK